MEIVFTLFIGACIGYWLNSEFYKFKQDTANNKPKKKKELKRVVLKTTKINGEYLPAGGVTRKEAIAEGKLLAAKLKKPVKIAFNVLTKGGQIIVVLPDGTVSYCEV